MPETPSWINTTELLKELKCLRKRLATLESVAAEYGVEVDGEKAPVTVKRGPGRPRGSGSPKRGKRGAIRGGVVEILTAAKKPMHANDILGALKERGVVVGGRDPRISLSRSLYSGSRFVNVGGNTWKLK